jgi:hypothetical protein
MKKILFTLITLFISVNLFAITHSKSIKPNDPIVFSINLPKDQVWQRLMDLFVANSIPIKFMDKSSGFIQSEKIGLGTHYALANADDSLAWALCEVVNTSEPDSFYVFPQIINTELQVYVRETTEGKVLLSLNLMNLAASYYTERTGSTYNFGIKSTERLENIIVHYLSTYDKLPLLAFDPPFATYGEAPYQTERRKAQTLKNAGKYQEMRKIEDEKRAEEEAGEKAKGFLALLLVIALGVLYIVDKFKNP